MKITDYLAIYAACLSTIVLVWNIIQSKPKIKVSIVPGVDEDGGGEYRTGVFIFVRNLSSHTVYLSNISILYPCNKVAVKELFSYILKYRRVPWRIGWVQSSLSNYAIKDGCPISLEARKSHRVFLPDEVVNKILKNATENKIMAVVQDQIWNNEYSKKLEWYKVETNRTEIKA